jgi:hypothetical protein
LSVAASFLTADYWRRNRQVRKLAATPSVGTRKKGAFLFPWFA